MATASIGPRPGESVTDENYLRRVAAVGAALWRVAKTWGATAGLRAQEHGPKNGTGHLHMLLGSSLKRLWIPRWRLMVTVLRATRADYPGRALPRRLVRAVRLAALSPDTVEKRARKRGRKPRVTREMIKAAQGEIDKWRIATGASWYLDVREVHNTGGGVVEVVKYLTKFSAVDPGLAISLDDAYYHRRRLQLLGEWRRKVSDVEWSCDDCGVVVAGPQKPYRCVCGEHHFRRVDAVSCEYCDGCRWHVTDGYVSLNRDGTVVGAASDNDDTLAALRPDTS